MRIQPAVEFKLVCEKKFKKSFVGNKIESPTGEHLQNVSKFKL